MSDDAALVPTRKPYRFVTEERVEKLLEALEAGFTRTAACAIAGVSRRIFYGWLDEDCTDCTPNSQSPEPGTLTNRERVEAAEAVAQARCESYVLSAVPKSTSDAWAWLRRRAPEDWAERKPGKNEPQPVNLDDVDWKRLTRDQLERILKGEDIGSVIGS